MEKKEYRFKDKMRFLHIGRFAEQKNHELMLEAMADIPHHNVCFQFIGGGHLEEQIKKLAEKLGVADIIEFLGPRNDVYPYLHAADAFLLPSKYEGMPMSLIEAMGSALPIIASNVGGVGDMLTHEENALLIYPSREELSAAIIRLMVDEPLRKRLGTEARKRANSFSSSSMASAYLNVYQQMKEQ